MRTLASPSTLACLLGLLALAEGPAHAATDDVSMAFLELPPHPVAGVERVLVLELKGSAGSKVLAGGVVTALERGPLGNAQRAHVGGRRWQTGVTVERLTVAEEPDVAAVAALAKEHGAQVVIYGEAAGKESSYREYEQEREIVEKTENGEQKKTIEVDCAERAVAASWSYRVFAADGSTVHQDAGHSDRRSADCDEPGEDTLKIASARSLWAPVAEGAGLGVPAQFRPVYKSVRLVVFDKKDTRPTVEALEKGDWKQAATLASSSLAAQPYDHFQLHHAGLAAMGMGDLGAAETLFALAGRYSDVDLYGKMGAVATLRRNVGGQLDALLEAEAPSVAEPLASTVQGARAVLAAPEPKGKAVLTKQSLGNKVKVLSAPKKGEVVAELRVGTRVYESKAEGGMLLVVLPDGAATGWVSSKNTKDP